MTWDLNGRHLTRLCVSSSVHPCILGTVNMNESELIALTLTEPVHCLSLYIRLSPYKGKNDGTAAGMDACIYWLKLGMLFLPDIIY